ncbi:MAG: sodium/proline symporter [Desulfurococcales archaeon]|nr:sodium/proline symporter [Desulfurococcales archaeon]
MSTTATIFATLGLYFVIVLVIGFIFEKKVKGLADYLLGGRKVGPYVIAFSERASEMSGWVGLGLPSEGFYSGLNATWNAIGCFYADLMNWTILAKKMRRFTEKVGALTVPEYYEFRLADKSGVLRITSALIIILFLTGYVGAQATAAGKVFSSVIAASGGTVTPDTIQTWIIVGALIMIIYTVLGGFFAVAWTDFIQGLWALLGFTIVVLIALAKLGNPLDKLATYPISEGSTVTYTDIHNFWGYEYTGALLMVIILSYIAIGFGWPGNPHITVRYMAIKSTKDIPKSAFVALALLLVIYYLAMSVGWLTRVAITEGVMSQNLADLVAQDAEYSFPALTMQFTHPILAGLILAAPVALMMSTADSQLLVATSAIIEDIYRRTLAKEIDEKKLVLYGRIVTFVLGILALIWALYFETSVYYFVLFSWGGLGAALGSVTLLTVLWKRMTPSSALAGLVTGAAGVVIWKSYSKGWILMPGGDPNGALTALAISVPIIVLVLGFIGMYLIEKDPGKAAKGAIAATIAAGILWVIWVFLRYKLDPDYTAWWYELLISFPMAIVASLASGYVTTPPPEDELEAIIKNFYGTESQATSHTSEIKPLAVTEIDVVKAYLTYKGI